MRVVVPGLALTVKFGMEMRSDTQLAFWAYNSTGLLVFVLLITGSKCDTLFNDLLNDVAGLNVYDVLEVCSSIETHTRNA